MRRAERFQKRFMRERGSCDDVREASKARELDRELSNSSGSAQDDNGLSFKAPGLSMGEGSLALSGPKRPIAGVSRDTPSDNA